MDQYPTPERSPENLSEISISEDDFMALDALNDEHDDEAFQRDAWMEENGLKYGDKVIIKIGDKEAGVFITDKDDFFTRDKAATLELRDSLSAAGRIMGEEYKPAEIADTNELAVPKEIIPVVEQENTVETLRIEAAEDMAEIAVDDVVSDPEGSAEASFTPDKITGEALEAALESASHQFELRENYAREELSENASLHLSKISEGVGSLALVGNVLSGADELKVRLNAAYTGYTDSMNELRARGGIRDFNPKDPFMLQFDQIENTIVSVRTGLMRANEGSVNDVKRSLDAVSKTTKEVTAEIDKNEETHKDVLSDIARHSDAGETTEAPVKDSAALRAKVEAFKEPIDAIRQATNAVEGLLDTKFESVTKILRNLAEIRDAVRFDRDFNPQLLKDVYTALDGLGTQDQLSSLSEKQATLQKAVGEFELVARAIQTPTAR